MKTPRELLLEKHSSAIPALNAVRRRALEVAFEERKQPTPFWLKLWQELVLPYRHMWAGLAVAWGVIVVLSLGEMVDYSSGTGKGPAFSRESVLAAREQMVELMKVAQMDLADLPLVATPAEKSAKSSNDVQKPRSERRPDFLVG